MCWDDTQVWDWRTQKHHISFHSNPPTSQQPQPPSRPIPLYTFWTPLPSPPAQSLILAEIAYLRGTFGTFYPHKIVLNNSIPMVVSGCEVIGKSLGCTPLVCDFWESCI